MNAEMENLTIESITERANKTSGLLDEILRRKVTLTVSGSQDTDATRVITVHSEYLCMVPREEEEEME